MRPRFAHHHNTAFARSSSLGEVPLKAVIKEVTIARGNSKARVIVKDNVISQQDIPFRVNDNVTFKARLQIANPSTDRFFYATVFSKGRHFLLFARPINSDSPSDDDQSVISHTLKLRTRLAGLNFHISAFIPTNLVTTFLDSKSRAMLRANPSAYSSLGFMPTKPKLESDGSDRYWDGDPKTHDWDYGRTGESITPTRKSTQDVLWKANYDAGWLANASVYRYEKDKGWEAMQQNDVSMQVGQPHCIVGQMVRYSDTTGLGGEYHFYNSVEFPGIMGEAIGDTLDWRGTGTRKMPKENIRLVNYAYSVEHRRDTSKWFEKNKHHIQKRGGEVNLTFEGDYFLKVNEETDSLCAKVEWWNPSTEEWSTPMVHPPYDTTFSGEGKFVYYFRFPRQLNTSDEFYDKTPQWQIGKTRFCYPFCDGAWESGDPVRYTRIGRPLVDGKGISVIEDGKEIIAQKQSMFYHLWLCPPAKSDDGSWHQKERFIMASNARFQAVDPFAYSYANNPDIVKAYWVNGNFQPGGSFMVLGKALDFFFSYWVSTTSLKTKSNTPMDLNEQQRDMTRGNHSPNDFTADSIKTLSAPTFRLTDIDKPDKVAEFLPFWQTCFPGVPLTKEVVTAVLRGDQLPELEGIENKLINGFLEDDPLKYEVDYEGTKFRHSYSMVYCKIPEGWWGPTIIGDDTPFSSVYIGGKNLYQYIHEEKVDLVEEIEVQKAIEAAGATPVETFANSDLENPMVNITYDAYKARHDTVEETSNDGLDSEKQKEKNWFFRTESVKLRHKKFSLLGSVGQVTDVTDRYSADQVTSLDGLSKANTAQYGFNDLFLVEGLGNTPSIVLTPPKEPESGVPVKHSNVSGFGNSGRQALKARALGHGNPMKYSTESKQTNLKADQMGGILNDVIDGAEDAVKSVVTTAAFGIAGLAALGLIIKAGPALRKRRIIKNREEESAIRLAMSEIDLQRKLEE